MEDSLLTSNISLKNIEIENEVNKYICKIKIIKYILEI